MTNIKPISKSEEVNHFKNIFPTLTKLQKKIFKYLHWFSKTYRVVQPSHKHIAKKVGCSRDTIIQAIKKFEELGWVTKMTKYWKTCVYCVADLIFCLNLDDKNTFRWEPQRQVSRPKEEVLIQKPTLNPTPIKDSSIYTLNVNVDVQKINSSNPTCIKSLF